VSGEVPRCAAPHHTLPPHLPAPHARCPVDVNTERPNAPTAALAFLPRTLPDRSRAGNPCCVGRSSSSHGIQLSRSNPAVIWIKCAHQRKGKLSIEKLGLMMVSDTFVR